ncbi:hypothetical protein PFICI_08061 [Pestalotiopsis fici W106-1]|uniref:Uncharacterized protein n=1 Tax=Pestalotiopsis fici (strain W106-1 / CGMCC3.15140) TaxID=1229662 RepID=W3X538_PESFW|nr:uncharacterized protein PFICI_08061 [Pestalotiopsis fici W106-1]ETS80532.1 hypothetical protein PFICI_08061 [Pestalotiopsis fici W106-1]
MQLPTAVDVLIIGAGPVGLITAVGLQQQGVETLVVEKRERDEQATYGRACTLYPRSLELLEQVDLATDLIQEGFAGRSSVNYANGKRINERGWNMMFQHFKASFHDYALNVRQKYSEDIFRNALMSHGKQVGHGWKLSGFSIDTSLGDGYNVSAVLEHATLGESHIRCKYIVGADGSASTVRNLADIPQDVDSTVFQWIRIDGKMTTDMPGAELGFAAVETTTHGNVLWVKLNKDAYRVGYALSPALLAKYPNGLTKEVAVAEAIEGMKPFKLSVERVDWWTDYKIRQSVATQLQKNEFILLAGDAAHTHSSGFAQGMNTGIHDATNLIWKLSGSIKGWYQPSVLASYHEERHAAATRLINIDRNAAAAISGEVPPEYAGRDKSPHELLKLIFVENIGFNIGLGVSYAKSVLNQAPAETTLPSGWRAPDALLHEPGTRFPLRFYDALLRDHARGRWNIVVFAGNPAMTSGNYRIAADSLSKLVDRRPAMFHALTIIKGDTGGAWAALGGPAWGKFYLDLEGKTHSEYGVEQSLGAIVVIRPDHILAYAASLDSAGDIATYFNSFIM